MVDAYLTGLTAMVPNVQLGWGGGAPVDFRQLPERQALAATSADWFDAKRHLAGIKHRYLNNATRYSVAAAIDCLRQGDEQAWYESDEERRGVILGTAVADYAVRHEVDRMVINGGSGALNTVSAPNISANIAAAYVAIACRGRAFSTTMTSPFLAGFESLFFAVQSLSLQRTDAVLSIAAEEALPENEHPPVVPGAVVAHLQAEPAATGRRIAATAWGYQNGGETSPSRSTQRFVDGIVGVLGDRRAAAQMALLRDDSAEAAATAACWHGWLNEAGMAAAPKEERVFCSQGTVEPMLWAAHWLTLDRPVVLIAIQQRRYLAFLLTR